MGNCLPGLLDRFEGLRVLVIGDSMLDIYVHGVSHRLCPEAPVPVVETFERSVAPGGAANTAANVARLGPQVHLLSVIGADEAGVSLRDALAQCAVDTSAVVVDPGRRTLAKERIQVASQLLLRLDRGDTAAISPDAERELTERLMKSYFCCDAIIISDYGYGVLTPRLMDTMSRLRQRSRRLLVVDSKRLAAFRPLQPDAVKPNFCQACTLFGDAPAPTESRADWLSERSEQLLELTGADVVATTLDVDGAFIAERGQASYRTHARANPNSKAAGAGDTYVSALALALAAGAAATTAADVAAAAAGVVVEKAGTASCSLEELRASLGRHCKFTDLAGLLPHLEGHRGKARRVVLTNGCFDILHSGHVRYLARAKALGDILVVGVNTDNGIRRLKGEGRPINSLEDRIQVLSALESIDHLVAFDDDTPHRLVEGIRPEVFVKGGDYTRERLPEADLVESLGGAVHILPLVENRSTTHLIQRIRAQATTSVSDPSETNTARGNEGDPAFVSPGRGLRIAPEPAAALEGAES